MIESKWMRIVQREVDSGIKDDQQKQKRRSVLHSSGSFINKGATENGGEKFAVVTRVRHAAAGECHANIGKKDVRSGIHCALGWKRAADYRPNNIGL